jgi:hypothetical protein
MARLTAKAHKQLPKGDFLGPGRSFPGNDKTHLEKAIQLAPRSQKAGNISRGTMESIIARAKARLANRGR